MGAAVRYVSETGQVLSYAPAVNTPDYEDRPGYLMVTRPGKVFDLGPFHAVPISQWVVRGGSLELRGPSTPVASTGTQLVAVPAEAGAPLASREAAPGLGRPLVDALARFKKAAPPGFPIDLIVGGLIGTVAPTLTENGQVKAGILAGLLTLGSAAFRAKKERNLEKMFDSMSASLWEAIGKLNVRVEDLEAQLAPETVKGLLEAAIQAKSPDALEAAKRAFRNLVLRGGSFEGQEVTRQIASLDPLQLLALRDFGYWNSPPYPRPVQPLARSIEIAEQIAESACRALESKGLLAPGFDSGTYLLSDLGRTVIAVLEEPLPPAPAP
jgi:hypothetical protein